MMAPTYGDDHQMAVPRALDRRFITGPDGATDAIVETTDLETIHRDKLKPDHGTIEMLTRRGEVRTGIPAAREFPICTTGST